MLEITNNLLIPDEDLSFSAVRSGGPGGQNVNKVASKVELRLQLRDCLALSDEVKQRLIALYPSSATAGGEFLVTSSRYRTQARNREDAEQKLAEMIRAALTPPKKRRPTKPSRAAQQRRLNQKKRRSASLKERRPPRDDD